MAPDTADPAARTVVQVSLRSGSSVRTCWVDRAKRFRIGDRLTLKNSEEPERLWTVLTISEPKDASLVHTDWKVGGIDAGAR